MMPERELLAAKNTTMIEAVNLRVTHDDEKHPPASRV